MPRLEYLDQILAELGPGSKLVVEYFFLSTGNLYRGVIWDGQYELFAADFRSMEAMLVMLDDLAEEWLSEQD